MERKNNKNNFYQIYFKAHQNAAELLTEAEILHKNKKFARAYFLAFTGLEEISKSQLAADVYTGFVSENLFWEKYRDHKSKIDNVVWAHYDSNSFPYNQIWLGLDIDDTDKIAPSKPIFEKRQKSLYVDINNKNILIPKEEVAENDAFEIIHILKTALTRIWEVTEYWGHQIGTKGFMK